MTDRHIPDEDLIQATHVVEKPEEAEIEADRLAELDDLRAMRLYDAQWYVEQAEAHYEAGRWHEARTATMIAHSLWKLVEVTDASN